VYAATVDAVVVAAGRQVGQDAGDLLRAVRDTPAARAGQLDVELAAVQPGMSMVSWIPMAVAGPLLCRRIRNGLPASATTAEPATLIARSAPLSWA
jgi:hypothetical protein